MRTTIELQEHIQKAKRERDLYKQTIADSKTEVPIQRPEGRIPPCRKYITLMTTANKCLFHTIIDRWDHYSFSP